MRLRIRSQRIPLNPEVPMRSIRWIGLSLFAGILLLFGCGGGGGSATSAPGPVTILDPSGIWAGTAHSNSTNQNYPVNAVILPDGTFRYASVNPLHRLGTEEEIAHLALHLLSSESAWTTGTVIPIDGGAEAVY